MGCYKLSNKTNKVAITNFINWCAQQYTRNNSVYYTGLLSPQRAQTSVDL
jgi:hypothetical protein